MMEFLVVWFLLTSSAFTLIFAGDQVAVWLVELTGCPWYLEAEMVAALIYGCPKQWEISGYTLKHPEVGEIRFYSSASGVTLEGPFGKWEPNFIERRIIWNAIRWYQHEYIKSLLRKQIS